MPTERLNMRRIRDVLRLKFAQGLARLRPLPELPIGVVAEQWILPRAFSRFTARRWQKERFCSARS